MAAQPDAARDRQIQAQVQSAPQAQSGDGKSSSRTVTDTIIGRTWVSRYCVCRNICTKCPLSLDLAGRSSKPSYCIGEHEHTIVGYSLVKGIGDGEPIASERFSVGGHEWVRSYQPLSSAKQVCCIRCDCVVYALCLLSVVFFRIQPCRQQ